MIICNSTSHFFFFVALVTFVLSSFSVLSLQELCCRAIVARTSVYGIDQLPLPVSIKSHLKSYDLTSYSTTSMHRYVMNNNRNLLSSGKMGTLSGSKKLRFVGMVCPTSSATSSATATSSSALDQNRTNCVGRNSCCVS